MPRIKNYDLEDVYRGVPIRDFASSSCHLIQIFNPGEVLDFPFRLSDVVCGWDVFEFLDVEMSDQEGAITEFQAKEIHRILLTCLENDTDVIVHCYAGICRSGAVVRHAVDLGFDDPLIYRAPNMLVYKRLQQAAGMWKGGDFYEEFFGVNNTPLGWEI